MIPNFDDSELHPLDGDLLVDAKNEAVPMLVRDHPENIYCISANDNVPLRSTIPMRITILVNCQTCKLKPKWLPPEKEK